MITLIVVAVLAFLLVIVLKKLFAKPAAPPPKPVEDLGSIKVTGARAGDSISIAGAGDNLGDLDFTIEQRRDYDLGPRRWIELRGRYRERRVLLEISVEDEAEVFAVTDPRALSLEDIDVSEDDLAQMDERQNASDYFEYDGQPWYYRLSREFPSPGAPFYGWVFRQKGGGRTMLVRKAEGEPFTVVIGTRVNPDDITVYRA